MIIYMYVCVYYQFIGFGIGLYKLKVIGYWYQCREKFIMHH